MANSFLISLINSKSFTKLNSEIDTSVAITVKSVIAIILTYFTLKVYGIRLILLLNTRKQTPDYAYGRHS